MKKHTNFTKEEEQILMDFESSDFESQGFDLTDKKRYQLIAKNTLNKTKNINLRVSERVLLHLKSKATELGIPYQTLVSSILHRYVNRG